MKTLLSHRRLLRKFRDMGGGGQCSGIFEEMAEPHREVMASSAGVMAEERPVIACYVDENHWVLLTDRRLVRKDGSQLDSIASTEIQAVGPPPGHFTQAGSKKAMSVLVVETAEGGSLELHLEPGQAYFSFWNVLRIVAR